MSKVDRSPDKLMSFKKKKGGAGKYLLLSKQTDRQMVLASITVRPQIDSSAEAEGHCMDNNSWN